MYFAVWIESPLCHGETILFTLNEQVPSRLESLKVQQQYLIQNALIDINRTKIFPTFAKFQVMLDKESSIEKIKPLQVIYDPINLHELPSVVGNGVERVDIIVKPIFDLGGYHPRRIKMVDNGNPSNFITLTLWDEDAVDENAIEAIMSK